jgi:predicted Ser/Thr protein kinase
MDDSHGSAAGAASRALLPDEATILSARPEDAALATATVNEIGRALEGRVLGAYRLDEFVGGGGMGAVFRALDTTLDRPVAVKVLSRRHSADAEMLRRFNVEAQSAARLDHENIGRVYAVGSEDGWHFIVFEFIDGTNLRDVVARGGPLDVASVIRFTVQIAAALDHAAEREVVHRDIKPSNIIITPEGRARLVDMGLARRHRIAEDEDLTHSGMTLGTFDYISPEQARDPRAADVRSDLYSLGCTVYFMLAGRAPFADGTLLQKLLHHQQLRPVPVEQLRPDVPRGLAAAVGRLMEKDPADRYQTPADLVADLIPIAEDCGIDLAVSRAAGASEIAAERSGGAMSRVTWLLPLAALAVVVAGLLVASARERFRLAASDPAARPAPVSARKELAADRPPRRVVDAPAGPAEWESVAAALAGAAEGDVVELAFDGVHDEPAWSVGDRSVTVRAAPGHAPVVHFADEAVVGAEGGGAEGACRVGKGALSIERVSFRAAGRRPLFSVGPGGRLACDHVTIEGEGAAVGNGTDPTGAATVVRFRGVDEPAEPLPSHLRFTATRVRGMAILVEASGGGTLSCEWIDGECDLVGRFLVADGSPRGGTAGLTVNLDLRNATFRGAEGFAALLDSPARPVPPRLRGEATGCRFVVPDGYALIEQTGIDVPAAYRPGVEWSDSGGRYEGSGVWRRIDGAAERIDIDYSSAPRPLTHEPMPQRR